ncbi:Clp protease ClpP (plasmid) [Sarcina sp. JB2]|uniref:Clp protease ClpP n=1 Tax=Candidatus Sarcina troglodytae TaxID=2726954 RepID=A0ACD1BGI7_9CLOT|nr:head maturation protease, ClpP-related [Sarcina sp. JB2]QPJ86679.1 Clp protease ClpP [Sarcina sp. JB2]
MKVINFKNKADKTVGKLEIKNINGNSSIRFDGDIVDSDWDKWNDTDSCPSDVLEALNGLTGDLDIYINSGGGSVFSGMSIYNILSRYKGNKIVYVDGLAGSIASVIAMAGDKIVMPKNSFLMIHKPLCMVGGNANDFRKMADTLDTIEQGIINVYATKLKDGANIDDIKSMVNNETWLTGEQAQQYFNIEVSEANNAIAFIRKNDFQNYLNDKLQEPKPVKNPKQQISTPTVEDKEQLELETELLKLELEL